MRIYILGQSGSGKSTLAKQIARIKQLPYIELDKFWFENNQDRTAFADEVKRIYKSNDWVIDGKHKTVRNELIDAADQIIYLDLPLHISLKNNIKRAVQDKENLFTFTKHLLKVAKEFRQVKRQINKELSENNLKVVRLTSYKDLERFLNDN